MEFLVKSYKAPFFFEDSIPPSKSLVNRARIVQSYFPDLKIFGETDQKSSCQDCLYLDRALNQLGQFGPIYDCGEGGTTFRFFALRASRLPGEHLIKGSKRLFSRPQAEIVRILGQLGVISELSETQLKISSTGWKKVPEAGPIIVSQAESSQFLSALLINSWKLDFPLEIQVSTEKLSEAYLEMTVRFLSELGMRIEKTGKGFFLPPHQTCIQHQIQLESDLSSAFSIVAAAVLNGKASLKNFPFKSSQPDFAFIDILNDLGVEFEIKEAEAILDVHQSLNLKPIQANLSSSPDLFPVLSILCAFADGESLLYGAPQLRFKESNRIGKSAELLAKIGIVTEKRADGMKIFGNPSLLLLTPSLKEILDFDPDHDHRMAMAAGLLILKGFPLHLKNPEVVNKSFPEFWDILGIQP